MVEYFFRFFIDAANVKNETDIEAGKARILLRCCEKDQHYDKVVFSPWTPATRTLKKPAEESKEEKMAVELGIRLARHIQCL
jgi:hypothetical protein